MINPTSDCTLSCGAEVRSRTRVNRHVAFDGAADSEGCAGEPPFEWDFGDGTAADQGAEVSHAYSTAGSFTWMLTVTQDGAECETSGVIVVNG